MSNNRDQDDSNRERLKHLVSTVVQETVTEDSSLEEQNALAGGAVAATSTGGKPPKNKLLWSGDEPINEINTTAIIYGFGFVEGEGPVLEDELLDNYEGDAGPEGKGVRSPRTTNKMKLGKSINRPKNPSHVMLHASEEPLPYLVPVRYSLLEHFGENPKTHCKLVLDAKLDDTSKEVIRAFIGFCQGKLGIKAFPTIYLHSKSIPGMTTGAYWMDDNTVHVLKAKRMLVDVLRTIAHELTHKKQHETGELDKQLSKQDPADEMGDLNTQYENEAYEKSGNFVKEFVRRFTKRNLPKDQLYDLYEDVGQDLRHMTSKKLVKIKSTPLSKQKVNFKPEGFWYSVGAEWERWVASEMPHWKGKYSYQIDIDKSKILRLTTPEETLAFTEKYGAPLTGFHDVDDAAEMKKLRNLYIDWHKVAQEYSGIEIAPYQWSIRHKLLWYSTWDIASGCIWNASAVKGIKLISATNNKKKSSAV